MPIAAREFAQPTKLFAGGHHFPRPAINLLYFYWFFYWKKKRKIIRKNALNFAITFPTNSTISITKVFRFISLTTRRLHWTCSEDFPSVLDLLKKLFTMSPKILYTKIWPMDILHWASPKNPFSTPKNPFKSINLLMKFTIIWLSPSSLSKTFHRPWKRHLKL